jgi:hypothetical protein
VDYLFDSGKFASIERGAVAATDHDKSCTEVPSIVGRKQGGRVDLATGLKRWEVVRAKN